MKGNAISRKRVQQVAKIRSTAMFKKRLITPVLAGTWMERRIPAVKETTAKMLVLFLKQAQRECRQKKSGDLVRMKLSRYSIQSKQSGMGKEQSCDHTYSSGTHNSKGSQTRKQLATYTSVSHLLIEISFRIAQLSWNA